MKTCMDCKKQDDGNLHETTFTLPGQIFDSYESIPKAYWCQNCWEAMMSHCDGDDYGNATAENTLETPVKPGDLVRLDGDRRKIVAVYDGQPGSDLARVDNDLPESGCHSGYWCGLWAFGSAGMSIQNCDGVE